jgi:hypothetical protein
LLEAVHLAFEVTVKEILWASHPAFTEFFETVIIGGSDSTQPISANPHITAVNIEIIDPLIFNDLSFFIIQ